MVFVFFFLGEYASIVLMSTLARILFLGGWNMPEIVENNTFINIQRILLGLKACLFMFFFVFLDENKNTKTIKKFKTN